VLSRLARRAVARPRRMLVLSLVAFVVVAVLGGPAPGRFEAPRAFDDPGSQATAAREQIERATGAGASAEVVALVKAPPASPEVARVARELRADPAVASVAPPPAHGDSPLRSRDGRQTLVPATLRAGQATNSVAERLRDRFDGDEAVVLGGTAIAGSEVSAQATRDLARAELLAFPLLALLALLVFRGVAAALPLAVGGLSVLGAFAVLRAVNEALVLSPFALNLVIGLGLGVAVDYSLFCVSRFREELGRGADVPAAVRTTMTTAGRTVLFSAATVAAAMACLTVFPQRFLISMGIGGAVVAIVAAAATLLTLPALLVVLGPRLGKVAPRPEGTGSWYRFAHAVMRRPGAVAALTALVMLAIAAPTLGMRWSGVDSSVLPANQGARVVSDTIERDFPGADATPLTLALSAPDGARSALDAYAASLRRVPGARAVSAPRALGDGTWVIDVAGTSAPAQPPAQRLVSAIRAHDAPYPVAVGGAAADVHDQRAAVARTVPVALAMLVALTLTILWLMTGSILLPIKALVMNLLTTVAAAGVLVVAFQHGALSGPLGFTAPDGIELTTFLVMVAIVFGLSTDYGVFLLTRIKEARDRGVADDEAVAVGLQRTGAIVTAAAILLAVAIGAFATGKLVFLKELGVGAAAAVLLDAFVVRALLVPALMRLLGGANWWAPRPLRSLHARLAFGEG
jgi:uncharacterized membrane protein YdfJ with MMPL/SSD domain